MEGTLVVDLRKRGEFLQQYVDLRNRYAERLLTRQVLPEETEEWLKNTDVEIRCLIDGTVVTGAVVLYLNRGGEIAFFAREPGKGVGSRLLGVIEEVASERNLGSVWAWVLKTNAPALKTFLKNRYIIEGVTDKSHEGLLRRGYVLRKRIR